jgi:hypothetical protein
MLGKARRRLKLDPASAFARSEPVNVTVPAGAILPFHSNESGHVEAAGLVFEFHAEHAMETARGSAGYSAGVGLGKLLQLLCANLGKPPCRADIRWAITQGPSD